MILKAFTLANRTSVRRLAVHLERTDENEVATVADVRGVGERPELSSTLESMFRTRETTRGKRGLFHVAINPDNDHAHSMTGADWDKALASLEAEFSLGKQPRVIVVHHKKQLDGSTRPHIHAVYQIADVDRGRQIDDFGNSGRRCGKISRELERTLGHQQLPERSQRRSYDLKRHHQAKRDGKAVDERRREVREAWNRPDFVAALQRQGYDLAQGNGSRVLLVTRDGSPVALGRELEGVKAAAIKKRLQAQGHILESLEVVSERQKSIERGQSRNQIAERRDMEEQVGHTLNYKDDRRDDLAGQRKGSEPLFEKRQKSRQRPQSREPEGLAANDNGRPSSDHLRAKEQPSPTVEQPFRENSADLQDQPATPQERAQRMAEQFAENRRNAVKSEQTRKQERAEQFRDNKLSAFEERFGKREPDLDHGLEHEI